MFRGQAFINFSKMIEKESYLCLILLKTVFIKDPYLLFLSPEIFEQNLKMYEKYLDEFYNMYNDESKQKEK